MNDYKMVSWVWQPISGMDAGDWAAWVQAAASIIAIVWAAYSGRKQAEAQYKTAMEQIQRQHLNEINLLKDQTKTQKLVKLEGLRVRLKHAITIFDWMAGEKTSMFINGSEVFESKLDLKISSLRIYVLNELNEIKLDFSKVIFYELPNEETVSILANIRATLSQAILNTTNIDSRLKESPNTNTDKFVVSMRFMKKKIQDELEYLETEISKIKYPPFDW